jgi:hypothetical protein
MSGGASVRSLARWCPTPYNMSQQWLCHPFRVTDKTETIIGKANKRRPIKYKIEVGHNRRKNRQAKQRRSESRRNEVTER